MTNAESKSPARSLHVIAREVRADWKNVSPYAEPYLAAMEELITTLDMYLYDSAQDIVLRFLCNAGTWRGEVARRVKAELRAMVQTSVNEVEYPRTHN